MSAENSRMYYFSDLYLNRHQWSSRSFQKREMKKGLVSCQAITHDMKVISWHKLHMRGCTKANCTAEAPQVQNDSKYLWLISGGFTSFSPVAITRDSISIVQ